MIKNSEADMTKMTMTSEQWNGLVALIMAHAVRAAKRNDTDHTDAKRQAGECEKNVRKLFVVDES